MLVSGGGFSIRPNVGCSVPLWHNQNSDNRQTYWGGPGGEEQKEGYNRDGVHGTQTFPPPFTGNYFSLKQSPEGLPDQVLPIWLMFSTFKKALKFYNLRRSAVGHPPAPNLF